MIMCFCNYNIIFGYQVQERNHSYIIESALSRLSMLGMLCCAKTQLQRHIKPVPQGQIRISDGIIPVYLMWD